MQGKNSDARKFCEMLCQRDTNSVFITQVSLSFFSQFNYIKRETYSEKYVILCENIVEKIKKRNEYFFSFKDKLRSFCVIFQYFCK